MTMMRTFTARSAALCIVLTAISGCRHSYDVRSGDLNQAKKRYTHTKNATAAIPARTDGGTDTYVLLSTIQDTSLHQECAEAWCTIEAVDYRTPLLYSGVSIIASGIAVLLAIGLGDDFDRNPRHLSNGNGWSVGTYIAGAAGAIGLPFIISGLVHPHPEVDAPAPATNSAHIMPRYGLSVAIPLP